MKKLILSIILATITVVGYSQTNNASDFGILEIPSKLYNAAKEGGLFSASNYAVEPYATYAPANDKHKSLIGGGVFVAYNVNNYVGLGLGVDYLGELSLVSANLTLKLPVQPFSHIVDKGFLHDLVVTPFVLGGLGKPLSGASTSGASTIEDVGAFVELGHLWGGTFNVGACYGSWNNTGKYSGNRYHAFFGWSKGF